MPLNIFESFTNPITGEYFKTMAVTTASFTMDWKVQPKGYVPFEHIHYNQDEVFLVKNGELKIILNGKVRIVKMGETVTVPKGVAHIAFNNTDLPLECIVAYKPCLDQDIFMQCLYGLTADGYLDKKGSFSIPRMGYFLVKMKAKCLARPTNIPAPLFKAVLQLFYICGVLAGWQKLYKKYTGRK